MSVGQGSILTQQKQEAGGSPGPPFLLTSADNGLSVDPISGEIVLGQDPGALGDPAAILNPREIDLNGQVVTFINNLTGGQQFLILDSGANPEGFIGASNGVNVSFFDARANGVTVTGEVKAEIAGGAVARIFLDASGKTITTTSQAAPNILETHANANANVYDIQRNGFNFLKLDYTSQIYALGDIDGTGNSCFLRVQDGAKVLQGLVGGFDQFRLDLIAQNYWIGDQGNSQNGNTFLIDDTASRFRIFNIANNAVVNINGTDGFTGTVSPVTSITVKGGIVTAVS